jgi:hypothetical protein
VNSPTSTGRWPIIVSSDDANCQCAPARIVKRLMDAGQLRAFALASAPESNTDGLGNCHQACSGLLIDLMLAGQAIGWRYANGVTCLNGKRREHSWLEVEGWALDCTNGVLIFSDLAWYRRLMRVRHALLRDATATVRYVEQRLVSTPAR